jgi:hypothetical protein
MAEMKNISPHDVQNEAYSGICAELIFLSKQCYIRADCLKIRSGTQIRQSISYLSRLDF